MSIFTNRNDVRIAEEEEKTERLKFESQETIARLNFDEHIRDIEYKKEKDEKDREASVSIAMQNVEKARIEKETSDNKNKANIEMAYIKKGENIEIAEIKSKEKEAIAQKVSEMFSDYLAFASSQFQEKLKLLQHEEEIRKEKYIETLNSTREEKKYLIDASKEVKGQEKLDYLNRADDCEKTIKNLIQEDSEANQLFINKLAMLDYDQRKELQGNINKNMKIIGDGDIHLIDTYEDDVNEK